MYDSAYSSELPKDADLVFSERPLDINFPYIIEILDHPACLGGYDYNLFIKNKKDIEKKLLSKYCRKIIIVNESSVKFIEKHFAGEILKKCTLIRAAVKEQNFKKKYDKKDIQIVFIGSLANPDDFYIKGGLEALESFKQISSEFDNVSMLVRCKVPEDIRKKYFNIPNLRIIEQKLSDEELTNLMKDSDICLNPGHVYPLMATLESMSYGIPIIMLDTWGVMDYLTNNFNSILIKPSTKITEYKAKDYPLNIRSKEFISEIKEIDERVIRDICSALRKLITNQKLRERLGKNGRKTIKLKFSLEKRNKQLKKVFDEAIVL